jgi:hypothetical protein
MPIGAGLGARPSIPESVDGGHRMELDKRARPLTCRQRDISLPRETGHSGTEWQVGRFVCDRTTANRDLLTQSLSKALKDAKSFRIAFFGIDSLLLQKATDYPKIDLPFSDLRHSYDPVSDVREIAASSRRSPVPPVGPLKFALFRTPTSRPSNCLYRLGEQPIGIGANSTRKTQHSGRGANGRSRLASIGRIHQTNRIRARSQPRRLRRG